MKNKILFTMAMVFLVLLFSCNDNSNSKQVYLVLKSSANPFFNEIHNGVKSKIDSTSNLIVRSGKDESDITGQINILKSILDYSNSKTVDGLILTPSSSGRELIPYIKKIYDKGIPIVLVDTKIDLTLLNEVDIDSLPLVVSSNFGGGEQAARFALNKLTKSQDYKLLFLGGVESQESAISRKNGFYNEISKDSSRNIDITYQEAKWNRNNAKTITSGFYSLGRKFDVIFGANDEMALGALQAVNLYKSEDEKFPLIIGFDAISEARESIKEGILSATVAQNPFKMGQESIKLLNDLQESKKVHFNNEISTMIIEKKN